MDAVQITDPDHRHFGEYAHAERVVLPGDWTEPVYRLHLRDGTYTTATRQELTTIRPELTD